MQSFDAVYEMMARRSWWKQVGKRKIVARRKTIFLSVGLASVLALDAHSDLILEPGGDACTFLVEANLSCGGMVSGNTFGGTSELSNYSCSIYPGYDQSLPEVVYAITPQSTGEVTILVQSSSVDVDLYLMSDGCDPAACLASSEDIGNDQLSFNATAGTNYYVAVETADFPGAFDLTIDVGGGCPEDCDNGVDDDFDGDVDCDDADCYGDPVCLVPEIFDDGFEALKSDN